MLEMIGIGPFLTIPLMIASMHGPQAMLGWLAGAIVAICDGLVWAELGAAMPEAGGPYRYLNEAYKPLGLGRLMGFLFLWQCVATAPLSVASGAVGFSQYARYLWPAMTAVQGKLLAIAVCLVATVLLYREIHKVGRLSVAMWSVVIATVGFVTVSGLLNFDPAMAFQFPPRAFHLSREFLLGLGAATLIAMYDYGGYNNVCFFAGEVKDPGRVVPRSIMLSILGVATVYLVMNVTIIGVVPWQQAINEKAIVSTFIGIIHGETAARVTTVFILFTAFASIFALMLGYSRLPYAAAVHGDFFRPFARLHATRNFPNFAVLFVGGTSAFACLLELEALVKALIVIQVLIQSLSLVVAVTLIRRYRPDIQRPFRMWLYPLPSIVAFAGWAYIFFTSGLPYIAAAAGLLIAGVAAYRWKAHAG
ncbi:MAG: APC family permease [Bryobacteraceae bacterium]|nr:APC family permease [Bryobacteraceae bacterium]